MNGKFLFLVPLILISIGCGLKGPRVIPNEREVLITIPFCMPYAYTVAHAIGYCQTNFSNSLLVPLTYNDPNCSEGKFKEMKVICRDVSQTSSQNSGLLSQSSSDIEISRIELRTMQTRKFRKSPIAVVSAINELNKDKGNSCSGLEVPTYKCEGTFKDVSVGNAIVKKCIASDGVSSALVKTSGNNGVCKNKSGQISTYDIDSNYPSTSETIVRIRLSDNNNPQLTDPQIYSKLFKEIADGLFIDAIQLSPAEMQ